VGILTHEGVFGPLLFAEKTRAFFIELKPGMFLSEHPHPTESIVYTVSGKWVLCSEGKRHVMETGSVFHFGSNMPTGWEAPFAEGALLFVVKSKEEGENYETYMKGLLEVKETMNKDREAGSPFYYNELKPDHPAILFARSVNPDFDTVLKNISY
jgi:quercetin dioxygenase-like cupin family protein